MTLCACSSKYFQTNAVRTLCFISEMFTRRNLFEPLLLMRRWQDSRLSAILKQTLKSTKNRPAVLDGSASLPAVPLQSRCTPLRSQIAERCSSTSLICWTSYSLSCAFTGLLTIAAFIYFVCKRRAANWLCCRRQ